MVEPTWWLMVYLRWLSLVCPVRKPWNGIQIKILTTRQASLNRQRVVSGAAWCTGRGREELQGCCRGHSLNETKRGRLTKCAKCQELAVQQFLTKADTCCIIIYIYIHTYYIEQPISSSTVINSDFEMLPSTRHMKYCPARTSEPCTIAAVRTWLCRNGPLLVYDFIVLDGIIPEVFYSTYWGLGLS